MTFATRSASPYGMPSKGRDLGDAIGAVLLRHVGDDLVAAVVHEVDVDVRRGVPLEVQEPVEDEAVLDRIDIGEADGVVHERAAGAAAHRGEDVVVVGVLDEVLHDEDVAGVAGLGDDVDLLVESLAQRRGDRTVPLLRALLGHAAQLLLGREALRDLEVRHLHLAERELDVDHRCDAHRVLEGLLIVREELRHLFGALQVELGVVDHLETVLGVDGLALLDADHDVLGLGVLGVHVVQVVRHDHRDLRPSRDLADPLTLPFLFGDPVIHELEEVIPLAEDLLVLLCDLHRRVDPLVEQRARELALQARRQRDEPLRVLAQDLAVHARAVVVAVQVRGGHERDEVLIAGEVLRQEDEVEGLAVALDARVAVEARVPRDIRLDADDRLYTGLACGDVEVDRAIERAVVRERQRRHLELFRTRHEVRDARKAIEKAVFAVCVEVDELGDGGPLRPLVEAPRRTSV